jgi:hypothetical protein
MFGGVEGRDMVVVVVVAEELVVNNNEGCPEACDVRGQNAHMFESDGTIWRECFV